jgi:hypothetical protein
MKSDKLGKQFLKALHHDRKQIVQQLADIDHKIDAFGGKRIGRPAGRPAAAPDTRVDVRAGRKLTAAHRRAIREGIRKARAKKDGAEKK